MKRLTNRIYTLGAVLLTLTLASCREDSDDLLPYSSSDAVIFNAATKSFAAQFKILWNGINQNYGIWDVEKDLYGLDWDAVYDKYLPRFEALDKQADVSDKELKALLEEVMAPLHDGHIFAELYNFKSKKYVEVCPSDARNATREDIKVVTYDVSTRAYAADIIEEKHASMTGDAVWDDLKPYMTWLYDEIAALEQEPEPTDLELFRLEQLTALERGIMTAAQLKDDKQAVKALNVLAARYEFLQMPGLQPHTPELYSNKGLRMQYVLFEGNVVYLRFNAFDLSTYLSNEMVAKTTAAATPGDVKLIRKVQATWDAWFEKIQELKAAGALGGVIIDVRNNGGGMMDDYQYVLGALLPRGGFEYAKCRFKRGTGRYDYSPMMPMTGSTLETEHAVVTEPVVVLANVNSVSMSEMTSLGVKRMENGRLIGKRTWGGLCGLTENNYYRGNYAGYVGERGVTPVYVYVPVNCCFSPEGKTYEGIGVEPDIEVGLDLDAYWETGRDSQLDRALQYIREGK